MNRVYCISLKRIILLFVLVAVVVAGVFGFFQKINTHKLWASMLRESQRLQIHLDTVYVLMPAKFNRDSDVAKLSWLNAELAYAASSLTELINLDQGHQVQLGKILYLIDVIRDPNTDLSWLNSTEQLIVTNTIHDIGQKVAQAYWSILTYTSVDAINGPPFWYFGPAPPNEIILEEAAQLALNLTQKLKKTP